MTGFIPSKLPLKREIETKEMYRACMLAHRALAELKGLANSLPNQSIIINSLVLQEAKDSSEIENIITTHDELFRSSISSESLSHAVKEVQNYKQALLLGFNIIKDNGFLSLNHIKQIQAELEQNDAGFRKQSGTVLKNPTTGEIKFIPPQNPKDIEDLMSNLVDYINDKELEDFDPLVKMAIIHYQFETIHPFYDGNGRTGRIINILYLVLEGLLDIPILYLSRYIIQHKSDYYKLLNRTSFDDGLHEWIVFILQGIEQTATQTIEMIKGIEELMNITKAELETKLPKIYSKDLLELLFYHPYTKILFLEERLKITRQTASTYLKEFEKIGILGGVKMGREIFYVNVRLYTLLQKQGQ